ncbi:MAG: DegV family protein [Candidatus Aminicenantes bacterium]|jgi:DegV family protein with EDD domain
MKIKYLDGRRLYTAFLAGGNAVISDKNYLNKINVFPVPDSDTGTNLASTIRSISERAKMSHSADVTLRSIADAAIHGARGNSGLIFAQFLQGVSDQLKNVTKISTSKFGESVKRAAHYSYSAIVSPVEGTMLTVMREWADAVYQQRDKKRDYTELLSYSLQIAKRSLAETPKKLAVLAKAGVVDAGAKGFVDFLEGITNFIKKGRLKDLSKPEILWEESSPHVLTDRETIDHRYCSEALIVGEKIDVDGMKEKIRPYGSSAIVAGTSGKARIHIHTDKPAELFALLKDYGSIIEIKADDMRKQHEASHARKTDIALVTDSSCDLPQDVIDDLQIHVVPFHLSFGDTLFLDKVTILPDQFYSLLETHKEHPKSAQPPLGSVQSLFSFLASHYESILAVHISDGLSGAFKLSREAANVVQDKKIDVLNSKHLSASLGLIVLRIAEAIRVGKPHDEIVEASEDWIAKTRILVDVQTLKYMVRGGRVSPLKGFVAKVLNLKPIVSLDPEGKATASGKSFSRKSNMKKIVGKIRKMSQEQKIWNYSIVHAKNPDRAEMYARKLKQEIDRDPLYVMDISPVIGVHNGIGAVGIALMFE